MAPKRRKHQEGRVKMATIRGLIYLCYYVLKRLGLLPKKAHLHDYDMHFIGATLDYQLVCRCGDIAKNEHDALQRMAPLSWIH
jgi:hypothetical protein